jgi:hypothetical protein
MHQDYLKHHQSQNPDILIWYQTNLCRPKSGDFSDHADISKIVSINHNATNFSDIFIDWCEITTHPKFRLATTYGVQLKFRVDP